MTSHLLVYQGHIIADLISMVLGRILAIILDISFGPKNILAREIASEIGISNPLAVEANSGGLYSGYMEPRAN